MMTNAFSFVRLVIPAFTTALFLFSSAFAKSAHISLHASWNATSPAAEAAIHILDTSGPQAAATFLNKFCYERQQQEAKILSEHDERALIQTVASSVSSNSLALSTMRWVLSARVHSPRIRLHYGLSARARTVFSVSSEHPIFCTVSPDGNDKNNDKSNTVRIITDPGQLSSQQLTTENVFPVPPSLQPHAGDFIPLYGCDDSNIPTIMLYAHAAQKDLSSWFSVFDALSPSRHCIAIRFMAPEHVYNAPRTKPPLQAFVAHATLRSTEYKVVDDRVFETRLFPDCPEGLSSKLCTTDNMTTHDEYVWEPDGPKDEDLKFTPLQATLFVTHLAEKKKKKQSDYALLDSLRLFAEDAPAVTRSKPFRNAISSWWSTDLEKSATKAVRQFRSVAGDTSLLYLNGFPLDVNSLRQGVEPLLSCLSSVSSAAAHLSSVANKSDNKQQQTPPLPPRASASSSSSAARVRVLLPIHTSREGDDDSIKNSDVKTKSLSTSSNDDLASAVVWLNNMHLDSRYKKWPAIDVANEATIEKYVREVRRQAKRTVSDNMAHMRLVKLRAHAVTLLLVIDPADPEHIGYLSIPETVVRGDLPIRVALVLVPNSRSSKLIAAVFHHFLRVNGRKTAVQFLSMLTQVIQYFGAALRGSNALPENLINVAFEQIAPTSASQFNSPAEILEHDEETRKQLDVSERFAQELKLFSDIDPDEQTSADDDDDDDDDEDDDEDDDYGEGEDEKEGNEQASSPKEKVTKKVSLLCILNGIVIKDVSRDLLTMAVNEQQRVADMLEAGALKDVPDLQYMNPEKWISADANLIVVRKLSKDMRSGVNNRRSVSTDNNAVHIPARDLVAVMADVSAMSYVDNDGFIPPDEHKVTVWLAGSKRDTDVFRRAQSVINEAAVSEFAVQTATRFAVVTVDSQLNKKIMRLAFQQVNSEGHGDKNTNENNEHDSIFVINGRLLSASSVESPDDLFVEIASEFQSVSLPVDLRGELRLLYRLYEREVTEACTKESRDGQRWPPLSSVLKQVEENKEGLGGMLAPLGWTGLHGDSNENTEKPLEVFAVVDPTDRNAFIVAALMHALRVAYGPDNMSLGIAVVPASETVKVKMEPPKTFYKFALTSDDLAGDQLLSDSDTRFTTRVSFDRMPREMVMTLALETPRAWFVSSYSTNYDMDNVILLLVSGETDLFSEYELKNLIVEGSCIDEKEEPPQGLKLVLSDDDGVTVDTLVMANLGYFQLKVPNPGMWWLSLARGASSRIFGLRAMEMYKDGTRSVFHADEDGRVPVPVQSLSGAGGILLRVARKPGMEGLSVLKGAADSNKARKKKKKVGSKSKKTNAKSKGTATAYTDNTKHGGMMAKIKAAIGQFFSGKASSAQAKGNPGGVNSGKKEEDAGGVEKIQMLNDEEEHSGDNETVNVFSVASGHLYERFLKIMISSVTKHSSRKVKFWLLENYLSPSFKKALPEFAREHGASVGMVTYRWPGWLRAQTEKQRIIWAYKILFLDVLFPLDVGRIIFVDSDQVIRGDLAELMDIDLHGAPYGYVPFCDSREEVEGYRFWKTGFWKETLKDQKYRISALYVVDLKRFRETAAGDTLRFIYQSLSADPNSLSNLDQDLPNYASVNSITGSTVPIFNLPQDWLWCESWCDDESKKTAKAIDLCNNPMTKEPKLVSAKRIISEWVELDNNASTLTEVIYKRIAARTKLPSSLGKTSDDDVQPKREEGIIEENSSSSTCSKCGDDDDIKTEL